MPDQLPQLNAVSPEHLHAFEQSILANHDPNDLGGKFMNEFARGIPGFDIDSIPIPKDKMSRGEIRALAKNTGINTITVCACIMAWGGMRDKNGKRFFLNENTDWLEVAEQTRHGHYNRQTAYEGLVVSQFEIYKAVPNGALSKISRGSGDIEHGHLRC